MLSLHLVPNERSSQFFSNQCFFHVVAGIAAVIKDALSKTDAAGVRPIHLSFDIDGVDPSIAPGTGTKARGGLTYREASVGHFGVVLSICNFPSLTIYLYRLITFVRRCMRQADWFPWI